MCSHVDVPAARRRFVATAVLGFLGAGTAACGGEDVVTEVTQATVAGVGQLPGPVERVTADEHQQGSGEQESSSAVRPADLGLPSLGELVTGNRVILVGDSIFASTAPRFGGSMCERLNEGGWDVEINAEPGRFIGFARQVLKVRFAPDQGLDWDVAVMFFGSNYRESPTSFRSTLESLIDDLSPRPVLLLTVTEFRQSRKEVNYIIHDVGAQNTNVHILDWARITAAEPGLLNADGLHLSTAGENRITTEIALALGPATTLVT
ncbi:MAG: SGNH/GDSL hydrolase family protein, partial [Actinomycetota bacterium]|nr:SGNH/GDSL hydrolase family protein [Actinomycetota bacterium]